MQTLRGFCRAIHINCKLSTAERTLEFSPIEIFIFFIIMALGKHVLQANTFCVSLPVSNW